MCLITVHVKYKQKFNLGLSLNLLGFLIPGLYMRSIAVSWKPYGAHKLEGYLCEAIFSLNNNKAPGPDGYTAEFFKKSWEIVGSDVIEAVLSFFAAGKMLRDINTTSVTLVPKVSNALKVTDFRPISYCNIIYKCISKILANRMRTCLPFLISKNQAAFINGRNIGDNVLLAQEIVKGYHRLNIPSSCPLKVDLMKAFASVDWRFLLTILQAMEFPEKFIEWIKACLTTSSFSISINGALCGFFEGAKGLRQGDPISPYLCVIAMELLSCMLNNAAAERKLEFHTKRRRIQLTHLYFAEDLLIFIKGTEKSRQRVTDILADFYNLTMVDYVLLEGKKKKIKQHLFYRKIFFSSHPHM